jgi:hypothetical protein
MAFALVSLTINIHFLYNPPFDTPKSSLSAYLADNSLRPWAILSGLLTSVGDLLQFAGGLLRGRAGPPLPSCGNASGE